MPSAMDRLRRCLAWRWAVLTVGRPGDELSIVKLPQNLPVSVCSNTDDTVSVTIGHADQSELGEEMQRLQALEARMLATPDQHAHPEKMRQRRATAEHPFGTIKARMGATHFLMKTLQRVRTEMALHVLAYNLTRALNILGTGPLIDAMRA